MGESNALRNDELGPVMTTAFKGLALGLMVALAGTLVSLTPQGHDLEQNIGLGWLYTLRGAVPPPQDVVVVAIDRGSAARLNLADRVSRWPRSLHARLIDKLVQAGARVVAFDLTFDTASQDIEQDQALAAAMRKARNVAVVALLQRDGIASTEAAGSPSVSIERMVPPIPLLARAASAYAPFVLPKTERVDAYWIFTPGAGDVPTLPVAAFQIYALQAYEELGNLWRQAGAPSAAWLPAKRDALADPRAVRGFALRLRATLVNEPALAERMLKQLRSTSERDVSPSKKRIIESLLKLYNADESRYLNFYGPPRTIRTVPYYQALQQLPSADGRGLFLSGHDAFAGKAVFVGVSENTELEQDRTRDDYRTVFSRADGVNISGVEIAATAFANILDDRAVRPLGFPWNVAIIMVWGLSAGAFSRNVRVSVAAAGIVAAGGLYLFVAFEQFRQFGNWLPLTVPLAVQLPMALFGGVLLGYREARRERERIKRLFGYFLPRAAVDRLAKSVGPVTSADQLLFGVCLATDMENSTALAEELEPKRLSTVMNDYYASLFGPVERHGGVVSEVVGDAMLAIWAGASAQAALRRQACHAALDIADLTVHRSDIGEAAQLPTRIGMHAGEMLLGSVGAGEHYRHGVVGEIVSTATRIEGLGKYLGMRLLASETVVEGVDDILARPLGCFLLLGKSKPIRICQPLVRKSQASSAQQWLCEAFASALAAYAGGRWREAGEIFASILNSFPDDGPSRFYLGLCERYAIEPPPQPWDSTVRIEGK